MQRGNFFKKYVDSFEKKLSDIIIDDISPEIYCKKYLSHLLQHKKYYLAIYADVLKKLIQQAGKDQNEIALIDYGAGNGMLGIFAKFCGFKKVLLNDIDVRFLTASKNLASQLNIHIDEYIEGDIISVRKKLKDKPLDAIVGTDVIEHIYNLESFFAILKQMNPSMISVFTTASNPSNYFKVKALEKMQLKDELEGGDPGDHVLFGETALEPFLKIREQIIRKNADNLSEDEIIGLAKATRGLNEVDIKNAVQQYKISKQIPAVTGHATNTCNPLNGSWTERILSLNQYTSIYNNAGFTCKFYAGFYNDYETGFMNLVKKLLNAGITTFGKKISPYIVITGSKK